MNFFEQPKFIGKLKPEILTHPNIPKPLHGISPRTIMGDSWWNTKRAEVYSSTNYHCSACGVHKSEAKGPTWLEAHEYWKIDYLTGKCEILSIEPLCHYCHNFIHSGRLSMIMGTDKSKREVLEILEHGFKILSNNKLKCFPSTYEFADRLGAETYGVMPYIIEENKTLKWSDYYLLWEGETYTSKYKDINDWKNQYGK